MLDRELKQLPPDAEKERSGMVSLIQRTFSQSKANDKIIEFCVKQMEAEKSPLVLYTLATGLSGGYLPMDRRGADLIFQVISARYERGATVTTNTVYKQWARIFNNDATLTTAILDRLVHHCETITIEGKSYRMKDKGQEGTPKPAIQGTFTPAATVQHLSPAPGHRRPGACRTERSRKTKNAGG